MPVPRVSVRNCERNPMRPAGGNAELHPHAAAAVVHHLRHRALAAAHLRDDHPLKVFGNVDHQIFDRLDTR